MAKLEWLRSFVATAESETYELASATLGMAQPTVWKHVRDLSRSLELELVFPKSTSLTAAGAKLLPLAREVLARDRQFDEVATNLRLGLTGVVRVACYPAHVKHFIGEVAGTFKGQYPLASLSLAPIDGIGGTDEPLLAKLRNGEVDLAVGPKREEFLGAKLYESRIVVVVPDDHPWRKRKTLRGSMLRSVDLLVSPPGHVSRLAVERVCREAGFEPRIVTESSSWSALLSLGENRVGVPIVHDDTLDGVRENGTYPLLVDNSGGPIVREAWLQWRKNEGLQPIVTTFIDFVLEHAALKEPKSRRLKHA